MKTIENRMTSMNVKEGETVKQLTYADLIKVLINTPKKEGYSIDEIRQRLKILAILDINSSELVFEDTDFTLVKASMNAFKWGTMHKDILDFADHINTIK